MSNKIKVISAIVSETGVTLYTDTGSTVELRSDNYRTKRLLEELLPIIALHKVAEVDLDSYVAHKAVEAKSNGLVRFFRVARNKVKSIFGGSAERIIEPDPGMTTTAKTEEVAVQEGVAPVTESQMSELEREDSVATGDTTLVAVVNNVPIIGAEALESHIEAAAEEDQPVGFFKFMERLATVASERKHTAQELLDFMKRADLPIADDGCIIGYKALRVVKEAGKERHFVDHHTGNVTQKVGSVVEMPVEKVDDNRRQLCSNGLHIARRKYLTGYGTGSNGTITLAKIAPEDVIAVPLGEPDKMRCARYHIVAELPVAAHSFIRSNKPMTQNTEAATILGNVIKGNHVGVLETVSIGGAKGSNITITPAGDVPAAEVKLDETVSAKTVDDKARVEAVKPSAVNAKVEELLKADREAKSAHPATEEPVKDEPKVEPTPEVKPEPAKAPEKSKGKKSAPAKPSKPAKAASTAMTPEQKKALKLVQGGMSKREAERQTGVSARTIGRLLDKAA